MLKDEVKTTVSNDVIAAQTAVTFRHIKHQEAEEIKRQVEAFGLNKIKQIPNFIGRPKKAIKRQEFKDGDKIRWPQAKKLTINSNLFQACGNKWTVFICNVSHGTFPLEEARHVRDEYRHKNDMQPCPGSKYYDDYYSL